MSTFLLSSDIDESGLKTAGEDVELQAASLGPLSHICTLSIRNDGSWMLGDSAMSRFNGLKLATQRPIDMKPYIRQAMGVIADYSFFKRCQPLDFLLDACVKGNVQALRKADVVTWRGVLTNLMTGKKPTLLVSLIKGKLFIQQQDKLRGTNVDYGTAVGSAFETLFTRGPQDAQWANIVSRDIGSLNVLFCGEVDCVTPPGKDTVHLLDRRLELKTTKKHLKDGFKVDWTRHYLQSKLVGVPSIFMGYRDEDERIVETEFVSVTALGERLPGVASCIDRCCRMLETIKAEIALQASESPNSIWKVQTGVHSVGKITKLSDWEIFEAMSPVSVAKPVGAVGYQQKRRRQEVRRVGIVPAHIVDLL